MQVYHWNSEYVDDFIDFLKMQLFLENAIFFGNGNMFPNPLIEHQEGMLREHADEAVPTSDLVADVAVFDMYRKLFTHFKSDAAVEKWCPFHHQLQRHCWQILDIMHAENDSMKPFKSLKDRFKLAFCFRANCEVGCWKHEQFPLLQRTFKDSTDPEDVLKNANKHVLFDDEGELEQRIYERKLQRKKCQTGSHRAISRFKKSLIPSSQARDIVYRMKDLLSMADDIYSLLILPDQKNNVSAQICNIIEDKKYHGFGETQIKCLLDTCALAFTHHGIGQYTCPVGWGAEPALSIMEAGGVNKKSPEDLSKMLECLTEHINTNRDLLEFVSTEEKKARDSDVLPEKYAKLFWQTNKISAMIVQIQLCEYRQCLNNFRNFAKDMKICLEETDTLKSITRKILSHLESHPVSQERKRRKKKDSNIM